MDISFNEKNPILEEYKIKYRPEELTDDGIPNIETQLRELTEKDENLKIYNDDNKNFYNREMTQRVKCLCLHKMNKSIMINTYNLKDKDREKLRKLMSEYNDIDHKEIINEFNELICDELFENSLDYDKLPIYELNNK